MALETGGTGMTRRAHHCHAGLRAPRTARGAASIERHGQPHRRDAAGAAAAGEIDLIARDGDEVIFVEVKKSRSHADAADHLSPAPDGAASAPRLAEFLGR